jgi:ABC-type multidrug transport system fused ATPase/permease subunit
MVFITIIINSSYLLHKNMLHSMVRNKMSFFDSTPIGRIINRFSKDIEQIEIMIPQSYKIVIRCLFQLLITVAVITSSTPYFLLALIPMMIIYIFVQVKFIKNFNYINRRFYYERSKRLLSGYNKKKVNLNRNFSFFEYYFSFKEF